METDRLSLFNPHMRDITGLLLPHAWTLPFNTITEPSLQHTAPTVTEQQN